MVGLHRMSGMFSRMFPPRQKPGTERSPAPAQKAAAPERSPAPAMEVAAPERSPSIPADWQDLSWPERRKLAAAHSDEKIVTSADAERAIKAALAAKG